MFAPKAEVVEALPVAFLVKWPLIQYQPPLTLAIASGSRSEHLFLGKRGIYHVRWNIRDRGQLGGV